MKYTQLRSIPRLITIKSTTPAISRADQYITYAVHLGYVPRSSAYLRYPRIRSYNMHLQTTTT